MAELIKHTITHIKQLVKQKDFVVPPFSFRKENRKRAELGRSRTLRFLMFLAWKWVFETFPVFFSSDLRLSLIEIYANWDWYQVSSQKFTISQNAEISRLSSVALKFRFKTWISGVKEANMSGIKYHGRLRSMVAQKFFDGKLGWVSCH